VENRRVRLYAAFPAGTRRTGMQRRGPRRTRRALAEAEERRRPGALNQPAARKEINGRDGPEPVRYGDWELRGLASDF
jgi:hypothetical protein